MAARKSAKRRERSDYSDVRPAPCRVLTIELVVRAFSADDEIERMLEEGRTFGAAEVINVRYIAEEFEDAYRVLDNRAIRWKGCE